jgi:bleomycin hydrolase
MKINKLLLLLIVIPLFAYPQKEKRNKSIYSEKKAGYYQNVLLKNIEKEDQNSVIESNSSKFFSVDFSGISFPTDTSKYSKQWHNTPINQGLTGTCWCFSGISFIESEINRLYGKRIKLSEMYVVYWEYVEKARYYVQKRGNMSFGEGSESNAVTRMIKKYGIVPSYVYTGRKEGKTVHNHKQMFNEINSFLESLKKTNTWNEDFAVSTVKNILEQYMGTPPKTFPYEGTIFSPLSFLRDYLKINPDDYFSFMSTKSLPYNQKGLLDEADNWWQCDDYYNVSLNEYMKIIINAITKGYTISICGDVSEPGYSNTEQIAIIPTFDIPSEFIDEDSRQYRLENKSTTDDHCIHLVGIQQVDGKYWFLIKDSGSGAFDGKTKGYRFYSEDYIKLKMINILIHKDAAKEILDKIIK